MGMRCVCGCFVSCGCALYQRILFVSMSVRVVHLGWYYSVWVLGIMGLGLWWFMQSTPVCRSSARVETHDTSVIRRGGDTRGTREKERGKNRGRPESVTRAQVMYNKVTDYWDVGATPAGWNTRRGSMLQPPSHRTGPYGRRHAAYLELC